MDWMLISHIALWIGFVVLVIINLALIRQVGILYERIAPAGALMLNNNLKVGSEAPRLDVQDIDGNVLRIGTTADGNKSTLLFFVSPDCPVCGSLLPVLKSTAASERGWLDVILASDGEEQDHRSYIQTKGLESFPYVVSELLGKTYGVSKLPYAVLMNEQGRIAASGVINSREHLESLFEAKERTVASIQDYMKQRGGAGNHQEANHS